MSETPEEIARDMLVEEFDAIVQAAGRAWRTDQPGTIWSAANRDWYLVAAAIASAIAAERAKASSEYTTDMTAVQAESDAYRGRALSAEAMRDELVEALKPFAAVLVDIGDDETDADTFQPMSPKNANAPLLTVGDFRRIATALTRAGANHE